MGDTGRNDAFQVPYVKIKLTVGSLNSSIGRQGIDAQGRKGNVHCPQQALRMPTDDQAKQWLGSVEKKSEPTLVLMCETILLTVSRGGCLTAQRLPSRKTQ
jgi:hypothetical protein